MTQRQLYRTPGDTNENVVCDGPCLLHGIRPELTTTGTITLRNAKAAGGGSTPVHVAAIGLTQAGKDFDGAVLTNGLTVTLSVGSDITGIVFERLA